MQINFRFIKNTLKDYKVKKPGKLIRQAFKQGTRIKISIKRSNICSSEFYLLND